MTTNRTSPSAGFSLAELAVASTIFLGMVLLVSTLALSGSEAQDLGRRISHMTEMAQDATDRIRLEMISSARVFCDDADGNANMAVLDLSRAPAPIASRRLPKLVVDGSFRADSPGDEITGNALMFAHLAWRDRFRCSSGNEYLVDVYRWALSLGIPVGTHLAESENEQLWLEHGIGPMAVNAAVLVTPSGKRSVATLADVLSPELLCAHCVEVTSEEIAMLAGHDVPVVHCPRSNAMLGCGIAPLADLRAAGLRVGLGTDSPASTPSIDPWEELRMAVYAARARERRPDVLGAAEALRLATIDAARALALEDEIGSLAPGKRADLTILSLSGSPYDPVEDPTVGVVFGGSPSGVLETIVDGETRYRQGDSAWQEVRSIASAARRRMLA